MSITGHSLKLFVIPGILTACFILCSFIYLNNKHSYALFRYADNAEGIQNVSKSNMGVFKDVKQNSTEHVASEVLQNNTGKLIDLFANWTFGTPKACIYILTHRTGKLIRILADLDRYFLDRFNYPVVLFYTGYNFSRQIPFIKGGSTANLFFIPIEFRLPENLPPREEWPEPLCRARDGYKIMCRFHAKTFFEFPWIEQLDYYWRLDDDSRILAPINYDVFNYMETNGFLYGYHQITADNPKCTFGLNDTVEKHMQRRLSPDFYDKRHWLKMYYNNFEISKVSFWTSPQYKNYIETIDKAGGIFYYRWGDAPIKTVAVKLFVPESKIQHFEDIRYQHLTFKQYKQMYIPHHK